jgi:hypothetical protein
MSLGFTAFDWVSAFNWGSLGSNDFIDKTNKQISTFRFVGFLRLIDKNASFSKSQLVPYF